MGWLPSFPHHLHVREGRQGQTTLRRISRSTSASFLAVQSFGWILHFPSATVLSAQQDKQASKQPGGTAADDASHTSSSVYTTTLVATRRQLGHCVAAAGQLAGQTSSPVRCVGEATAGRRHRWATSNIM